MRIPPPPPSRACDVTMPAQAQSLTKSECDEVVMGLTELSRAAAGLLVHVENMNVSPLRAGGETVSYGSAAP